MAWGCSGGGRNATPGEQGFSFLPRGVVRSWWSACRGLITRLGCHFRSVRRWEGWEGRGFGCTRIPMFKRDSGGRVLADRMPLLFCEAWGLHEGWGFSREVTPQRGLGAGVGGVALCPGHVFPGGVDHALSCRALMAVSPFVTKWTQGGDGQNQGGEGQNGEGGR